MLLYYYQTQFKGRIYTRNFNRVEEGNNEDANRLFFPPKFYAEDGVVMGECEFFLYREDNSELEMVRELISGDKGILRCLANVEEPGIYNVTFRYDFYPLT